MGDMEVFNLSELDQIMPRLYVRWLLCFPALKSTPPKEQIIAGIQSGLRATLEALPVLRGEVLPKSSDSSQVEVQISSEKDSDSFDLKVKHLDDDNDNTIKTYESLRQTNFPVSELLDAILTPHSSTTNVFDIMTTFIRGGILICIKCHHAVVDGIGMGLVTRFLAQNCYAHMNLTATHRVLSPPSFDRSRLPLPQANISKIENIGFEVLKTPPEDQETVKYAPMTSHIFKFSGESIQRLKNLCKAEDVQITSHDALTALLYGSVSYARGLRLSKTQPSIVYLPSKMGIAVDGRQRLERPLLDYAGNVCLYATFSHPISLSPSESPSLSSNELSNISSQLNLPALAYKTHQAVASVTAAYIESTISFVASLQDLANLIPSFYNFYQGTDFFISSSAGVPVFDDEWWPGRRVEAQRIPLRAQGDGSCGVLAAKDRNHGLDVILGLREDDMEVTRDILFAFGAYIA